MIKIIYLADLLKKNNIKYLFIYENNYYCNKIYLIIKKFIFIRSN